MVESASHEGPLLDRERKKQVKIEAHAMHSGRYLTGYLTGASLEQLMHRRFRLTRILITLLLSASEWFSEFVGTKVFIRSILKVRPGLMVSMLIKSSLVGIILAMRSIRRCESHHRTTKRREPRLDLTNARTHTDRRRQLIDWPLINRAATYPIKQFASSE